MKIFYLIGFVFVIFLFDCSQSYRLSDFPSKGAFYKDYNNSAGSRNVNITLKSDSLFTFSGSTYINDNALILTKTLSLENKLDLREVKKIEYSNNYQILSGKIILINGKTIFGENIKILSDSSVRYITYKDIQNRIPLSDIKTISYKNRWLGIPIPSILGAAIGFGTGLTIISNSTWSNTYSPPIQAIPIWSSIGLVIGGVWGWLDGYTFIYEFNP